MAIAESARSGFARGPALVLGHAAGVALRIGDRPVEIPASFLSGNVARFVVGADGAVGALPAGSPRPSPP